MFRTKLNVRFDELLPPMIHSKLDDELNQSFSIVLSHSGGRAVKMIGLKDRAAAKKWSLRITRLIVAEVPQTDGALP